MSKILSEPEKHASRAYTLTGPEAYSCHDVVKAISKAVGSTVTYYDLPLENAKNTWLASGWPSWMADAMSELYLQSTRICGLL